MRAVKVVGRTRVLRKSFVTGCLALGLAVVAGCTYVPFDAPRSEGRPDTSVDKISVGTPYIHPGDEGYYSLADGNDALGARLRMIEQAQHSIDISTFLIKPDLAGGLVGNALLEAAERGVHVRLLVDDAFTTSTDRGIAAFSNHPNIDVRIFNPMSRQAPSFMGYVFDFGRVNRRMHNKIFVTDETFAIIGGRNFADEYYQIGTMLF